MDDKLRELCAAFDNDLDLYEEELGPAAYARGKCLVEEFQKLDKTTGSADSVSRKDLVHAYTSGQRDAWNDVQSFVENLGRIF